MIDHAWTVVCSRAVVDRFTNNVSMQHVIEQFTIPEGAPPNTLMVSPFQVISLWARSDFDIPACGRARLTLLSPSGKIIRENHWNIDMSSQYRRYRTRCEFPGLPADEPGRYVFRVDLQIEGDDDWHQVAAVPLQVTLSPESAKIEEEE